MSAPHRDLEAFATAVVDAGYQIHRDVGPGLLESVYETFLADRLLRRGLYVERQVAVAARYGGTTVDNAFRVDLLIERCSWWKSSRLSDLRLSTQSNC